MDERELQRLEADYAAAGCSEDFMLEDVGALLAEVRRLRTPRLPVPLSWLIYSVEHHAWWRAHAHGYTSHKDEAGRYTLAEAVGICEHANQRVRPGERPEELLVPDDDTAEALLAMFDRGTVVGAGANAGATAEAAGLDGYSAEDVRRTTDRILDEAEGRE